jgi:hypothetical protein
MAALSLETQSKLSEKDTETLAKAFDKARRSSYTARRKTGLGALGGSDVLHFYERDLIAAELARFKAAETVESADAVHPLFANVAAPKNSKKKRTMRDLIDPKTGDTVLQLKVPVGANGGQRVRIELDAGGVISVQIPESFGAGDMFRVRVPTKLKKAAKKKNQDDVNKGKAAVIKSDPNAKLDLKLNLAGDDDVSEEEEDDEEKDDEDSDEDEDEEASAREKATKKSKKAKKEKKEKKAKKKKNKKNKKKKKKKKKKKSKSDDSSTDEDDDDWGDLLGLGKGGGEENAAAADLGEEDLAAQLRRLQMENAQLQEGGK